MPFACVFPGQGSQSVGMLSRLLETEPQVQACFGEASEVLGYDLTHLVLNGPQEDLNATDRTQPALLTAGVSLWRLWCDRTDQRPNLLAGHSLGEYTALVCAGVIEFDVAVNLVALRGRAMQSAVPPGEGAMAAILGLDDEVVSATCAQASGAGLVSAANFNAPGQVVIAGATDAVNRAIEAAKKQGARKAIALPVSVPSHCALMEPAGAHLAEALAEIELSPGSIPVIHNVDAKIHNDAASITSALVRQIQEPVRWVDTIKAMADRGVTKIVELGPGKVLAGLNRRIDRSMAIKPVFDTDTLNAAIDDLENG